MQLSKNLQKTLMASAVLVMAFGALPALSATSNTGFGSCTGSAGYDCTAGLGHASVSITSTLSVNEMRAISFGNFAAGTPATGDTVILKTDGTRTATGGFVPLYGASGGGFAGSSGAADTGSQSPGHFTISGGNEGAATQIYISFADATTGAVIDMCTPSTATPASVCDNYHHGNAIAIDGPVVGALTMDKFVINESGSDVYGHYIDNSGAAVAPGTTTPFNPGTSSTSGHNGTPAAATAGTAGTVDVVVGATLHGGGIALTPGKYTGTFVMMASY